MSNDLEVTVLYDYEKRFCGFAINPLASNLDTESFCKAFPSAFVSGEARAAISHDFLVLKCSSRNLQIDEYVIGLTNKVASTLSMLLNDLNDLVLDSYPPAPGFKIIYSRLSR